MNNSKFIIVINHYINDDPRNGSHVDVTYFKKISTDGKILFDLTHNIWEAAKFDTADEINVKNFAEFIRNSFPKKHHSIEVKEININIV